jgi:acetyl-CoA synthetase
MYQESISLSKSENIAYRCVRKPCEDGWGDRTALRWISGGLEVRDVSYREVECSSNRIAGVLKKLGLCAGEMVSIFLPRSLDLTYAFFGILKNQAVSCILFSTFGENALYDRLEDSNTRILITKKSLLKKIINIQKDLSDLRFILVTDIDEPVNERILSLPKLQAEADEDFVFEELVPSETPAFLQYTSGSTGKPKGALHVHGAAPSMIRSFQEILEVHENEAFWCTADPAWITGLVYGIIAPFNTRTQQIQFSGTYHAESWLAILQNYRVKVWYTAPTALRMLMQEEESLLKRYDFSSVERIYSVGEPLNPEIFHWGKRVFGKEIYDTWFQSETGRIMIANRAGMAVKPGSMGKPLSDIQAYILDSQMKPVKTGSQGLLCIQAGWPSMFRGYHHKDDLYREKFSGENYITGDLAWKDEEGYFWYVSRADDVINTAGHLVGPFEVESALLEVTEIADVAVIGVHDEILHEKIVAFLCLYKGQAWTRALELKCRVQVSTRVSTTAIPQEFHVIDMIPKNQSGKILRRVLKARYEGKDPGDLSTMEER